MIHDPARLQRLLGGPEWAWWRQRAWAILAAGRPLPATLVQRDPSPGERRAANRLLAGPGTTGAIRLRHAELAACLAEAGIADDLAECLVALVGPLPPPDTDTPRWAAVLAEARAVLAPLAPPADLAALLDQGGLKRLAAGDPDQGAALAAQAAVVLERLAAGRPPPLALLAAACTGDAHALDRDRALGRLLARLLGGDSDARAWRAAWAAGGVATDEVSPSALALNLRAAGDSPLARHLELAASAGEPLRLTARQLRDPCPLHLPGGRLFVCENPAIVALAAERLGPACPPLLASEGWPTLAVLDLLERTRVAGATIVVQADFDWAGLAIAGTLLAHPGARPWRLTAAELAARSGLAGPELIGAAVATPWDQPLAQALAARGRALHEEALAEVLLADLAG